MAEVALPQHIAQVDQIVLDLLGNVLMLTHHDIHHHWTAHYWSLWPPNNSHFIENVISSNNSWGFK